MSENKSSSWSPVEIDNLITLVRERRDLYDQSSAGYSNLNTIDNLWRQISGQFPNRQEQELRKKWQILRTGYRSRRGEKYLPSGSGTKPIKKWVYFDSLMFLEPYMAERNTSSNIKRQAITIPQTPSENISSESYGKTYMLNDDGTLISDGDEEENEECPVDYDTQKSDKDLEAYSPATSDTPSTSKRNKRKLNPVDEKFISFFETKQNSMKREKSSNELFLASLLEDMNKLNPSDLRKFKILMLTKLSEVLENY
ncbi:hypothetical protein FQR65_LT14047 [Abscondita terminalis]|nr:hypothetical protein FQR65_LT14047 [Abscondita terminalis]